jgi:hypothetical protein
MTTSAARSTQSRIVPLMTLIYIALALTLLVMHEEGQHFGPGFIESWQLPLHRDIMEQRAGNPWQYRVLAPYAQEGVIRLLEQTGVYYDDAAKAVFMATRYTQTFIMFLLMGWYYRRLGLTTPGILLGMMILFWGFPYSYFESNQSFNTYYDVIFYLLAALAILYGRYRAILPITALAVLNRETSGLIPIMLLLHGITLRPRPRVDWRIVRIALIALAIFGAGYWGLRQLFPPQQLLYPFDSKPGIELLRWNFNRPTTWDQLLKTIGYLPLVALVWSHRFPREMRVFFWAVVPAWFVIHFLGSSVVETRLFFVPHILVLIPGLLLIARAGGSASLVPQEPEEVRP